MAKEEKQKEQEEVQPQEAMFAEAEAPASINVKFLWRGFDTMLTIRDAKVSTALKKYEAAIGHLEKMGATPTPSRNYGNSRASPNASDQQSGGNGEGEAPLCPTHNQPMKPSQYGGWYCTVKIADDDGTGKAVYCKQKAK